MTGRSILTALVVGATLAVPAREVAAQEGGVVRILVSGTIEMGLAPYIERSIQDAAANGALLIILEIETPGGRVDAAQRIVKAVASSDLPIHAFVNTHAWSAGAMIALAADSIYMSPGSSIGAATPVLGDGQKGSEKIVSAMRGEFRALAERRGLNPRVAEAMVDEEIEVEGVVEAGKLLTLTANEAVNLGLATAEVPDLDGLLSRLGAAGVAVETSQVNWAEKLVRILSHPIVTPLLLTLGTLGLVIEVKTPSFGVAGMVGLGSFAAFFGSHLIVGLAGLEEVMLLGVGLVALILEIFVVPGFGIAGAIAILSIGSAIFLSLIGNLPTWNDVARAGGILFASGVGVTAAMYGLVRFLPNSERMRGVFLDAATDKGTGFVSAPERADLVGEYGTTVTDLHPSGTVLINGEQLDVVSQGGFIAKGTRVEVVRSEGYRHVVTVAQDVLPA